MRWLVIALLVSLVALLIAAAGMVRHIWLHRRQPGTAEPAGTAVSRSEMDPES
jgi:uncharacterized membrane protein